MTTVNEVQKNREKEELAAVYDQPVEAGSVAAYAEKIDIRVDDAVIAL